MNIKYTFNLNPFRTDDLEFQGNVQPPSTMLKLYTLYTQGGPVKVLQRLPSKIMLQTTNFIWEALP